ncbi:MAG: cytochrome c biogenesis protein CcsA [Gammaproteobacteria bacterium]|nr:cytochrome c biogenesis protein CcsA [Gammaproteobacteria bacterium]
MPQIIYISITSIFYILACTLIIRTLWLARPLGKQGKKALVAALAAGLLFHAGALYHSLHSDAGLNLALTSAASLVSWTIILLYTLALIRYPIENLGLGILPITLVCLVSQLLWPSLHALPIQNSMAQASHITVSLLAYALLSLAAAQSCVVMVQEYKLRHKHPGGFMHALPPVQLMEKLMVQLVAIGFVLLTFTVISGLFFSQEIFGKPFKITHHNLLSIMAWLVYGSFLLGRWRFGWRGKIAIRWVLIGSALLVLGYLGTKFVVEIVLNR